MPPFKNRTRKTVVGDPKTQVEKRNRLANLLTAAAQIEHIVMAQYLFASATLKKRVAEGGVTYSQLEMMRKWSTNMMLVARQEMEHLGYASNLLTAIGGAPIFRRPDFPIPESAFPLNQPFPLDAFSPETALRFVCYEMPNAVDAEHACYLKKYLGTDFDPAKYDGIYRLYMEIESLFEQIDEKDLFIGPPSAQFLTGGNSVVARGRIYPQRSTGKPSPIYDTELRPVTNLRSARDAIKQIVEEGEGASDSSTTSHFARFLEMHMELTNELKNDPNFRPARNVVSNPRVQADLPPAPPGINYITHPATVRVMKVFDQAYSTLLLMLMRYFAHTDETEADLAGLQDTAFFPMMTMGIRPLAEVLTQLPALKEPNCPLRAGPSFTIPSAVQLLPHRESAWRVILGEFQLLTRLAKKAADIRPYPEQALNEPICSRLNFIHENFARMTMNFQNAMHARKMR